MKPNGKSNSSTDLKLLVAAVDFPHSNPRIAKKKSLLDHLYTSHKKILGVHRATASTQLKEAQNKEMINFKFKRTPSPEKRTFRNNQISPLKVPEYLSTEECIDLLKKNVAKCNESYLKTEANDKNSKKDFEKLKKVGFIDQRGTLNVNFIKRYEQVIGIKYELKQSISSIYLHQKKPKTLRIIAGSINVNK